MTGINNNPMSCTCDYFFFHIDPGATCVIRHDHLENMRHWGVLKTWVLHFHLNKLKQLDPLLTWWLSLVVNVTQYITFMSSVGLCIIDKHWTIQLFVFLKKKKEKQHFTMWFMALFFNFQSMSLKLLSFVPILCSSDQWTSLMTHKHQKQLTTKMKPGVVVSFFLCF